MTAITTIGLAGPATASATHRLPVPTKSSYRAIVNAIHAGSARHMSARDILTFNGIPPIIGSGSGQQATPQFGAGKDVVYVEPMAGTFPAGMTPDLSKVTFTFDQTMTDGTSTQSVTTACDNNSSGPTDPSTPCINYDPLQLDQPFTIGYDAAHSTLPTGFVAPATVTDTVSSSLPQINITPVVNNPRSIGTPPPTGCIDIPVTPSVRFCNKHITIQVPGTWRPIGLNLTNKATGAPLAHSRFVLSQGSTTLGTATTDSKGHLTFPGIYQGGNFTLTQESSPDGYAAVGGPLNVKVPAVTSAAQAGKEYDVHVKLVPLPPTAVDDTVSTSLNKAAVVKVLGNDKAVSAPLTVASVGKPAHGKAVVNPDGTITYTPDAGYVGTDTFTYAARNGLGGTDTATVTVTVLGSSVLGDRLAMTGQSSWLQAELGLGAMAVGGLLVAVGRRRRRSAER